MDLKGWIRGLRVIPQEPIRFPFDEQKATAAATLLLQLAGGEMEYMRLIKLLYYADRESLDRLGYPISGDQYFSLKHGPVLSHVYDLVKAVVAGQDTNSPWSKYIAGRDRYHVTLISGPDLGPLSDADVEILSDVWAKYGQKRLWRLRDDMHDELKEWEECGDSRKEIQTETILRVLGKAEEDIEEVKERCREKVYFRSVLGP